MCQVTWNAGPMSWCRSLPRLCILRRPLFGVLLEETRRRSASTALSSRAQSLSPAASTASSTKSCSRYLPCVASAPRSAKPLLQVRLAASRAPRPPRRLRVPQPPPPAAAAPAANQLAGAGTTSASVRLAAPHGLPSAGMMCKAAGKGKEVLGAVVFQPFEELKGGAALELQGAGQSLARHKFVDECEAAIKEQINVEYNASYAYVALKGFVVPPLWPARCWSAASYI